MQLNPDPDALFAIPGFTNTVFLRSLLAGRRQRPGNISVGAYSYYSDFENPLPFFERNVRYNFGLSGARLTIGRYCALAHGVTFVMADANHVLDGPTTFPFPIFGGSWAEALPMDEVPWPNKGDIVVGNDVWIGFESLVLPGVRIGHGAVIGARAVVSADVPDYAVVAGNPARVVRRRFDDATAARMLALAWWDWPADAVRDAVPLLVKGRVDDLEAFVAARGLTAGRTGSGKAGELASGPPDA